MTRKAKLAAALLAFCAAGAQAQLYKWVGSDGKVTYSDTPPPSSAKKVETKDIAVGSVDTANFPYELAQAVKASPVTLYTTKNCTPCDAGRKHLLARGIPFAEKTVNTGADLEQFHQAGGEGQEMPFLMVGRSKEHGFSAGAWDSVLSAAGYPETNMLPKSYRAPQAQAAAPAPAAKTVVKAADTRKQEESPRATELPPAIGNAPPGFRF
ncbi:MAG TPA: glutaredoxin family protein [Noviherbaspirillum sp.]|nr:glutaredoxin family protein [Noviherbaspirillum sp.]